VIPNGSASYPVPSVLADLYPIRDLACYPVSSVFAELMRALHVAVPSMLAELMRDLHVILSLVCLLS
jgi:hypothetical protein